MIGNYIKMAWRNLVKNPTFSLINILGLAMGMAVTVMIGLWVNDELNYNDYFSNKDRVAQIYQHLTFNGDVQSHPYIPQPLAKVLKNEYADYFKYVSLSTYPTRREIVQGENAFVLSGTFMEEDAPKILDLKIISGIQNGLEDINSIMLSATTAQALFGDENPINKSVTLALNQNTPLTVTGVYEDIPGENEIRELQFLAPWKLYMFNYENAKKAQDSWGNNGYFLFVEVKENVDMATVSATIKDSRIKANPGINSLNAAYFLLSMKDWHLQSNFENGVQTGGRIQYVWLFGIIGFFVLFLACINFMNLSTAKSEKRAKEVGIRKSVGSERGQLVAQFLTESFMVVVLAFSVALVVVLVTLPSFNNLAEKDIAFPWSNGIFWLVALLFVVLTALLSGSYPALYLSSFQPVKVLKGTFKAGRFASLPRKALVVVQFTVSVTLVIGTFLVFKQIQFSKDRPIGYEKEGLIQVRAQGDDFKGRYDLIRTQFLNSGAIVEMSSSTDPTTEITNNRGGFSWPGMPEDLEQSFAWAEVSFDWVKSLNLKIVDGRDFSRVMATDSTAMLINETAIQYMGLTDPVGTFVDIYGTQTQIIGVVEDMIVQSPYEPVKQALYVFDRNSNGGYYNLRLNPNQSASENMAVLEGVFKELFPAKVFDYWFVDEQYGQKFASEERIGDLASVFTLLAILISCLGIFGLASFMAEQRTKELGIRKVLGATVANLWAMLSKDFVILVVIALCIATPLAWYFMNDWLSSYTYRTDFSWGLIAVVGLGALVITLLTVSFQSIKAAIVNPVESLRAE